MLTEKILQLEGVQLLNPEEWAKASVCGNDEPRDSFVKAVLEQNLEGERCAIGHYEGLLDEVQEKDPISYQKVLEILQDEIEHENDIQGFLEDLQLIKSV